MEPQLINILVCQINPLVGDIDGNTDQIIEIIRRQQTSATADVLVFPELVLTGYPPEDLLLRPSLERRIARSVDKILAEVEQCWVLFGLPLCREGVLYNAALLVHQGKIQAEYHKVELPNYRVFDEKRYFQPGDDLCTVEINGINLGICICEDLWFESVTGGLKAAGAEAIISINASPYHYKKHEQRLTQIQTRVAETGLPIIYAHMVGGQDELVFDGGSFAVDGAGELVFQAPWFESSEDLVKITRTERDGLALESAQVCVTPGFESSLYSALVIGVRDYIGKNGFKGVILGLSGGIDSALTLAVAADALGPDRVEAVMMPFKYTSEMSQSDAAEQARNLGVRYSSIGIEPMYDAFMGALSDEFLHWPADKTEENVQARCRGLLLMSISNKKGYLVLTTGNKSEMSVGYATLYGDMAGGFAVLKDLSKMRVYQLARYRNSLSPVIPQNVIDRPPSAELAPDQKDEDSLPPYPVLDQILEMYIEEDRSADDIVADGFDSETVSRVLRLVDINEYKRRQSAIGPRVTPRGFGRDRRYPITNGWKIGD